MDLKDFVHFFKNNKYYVSSPYPWVSS